MMYEKKEGDVPSIDLNHAVFAALGVQRVLDVALADDAEMANDLLRWSADADRRSRGADLERSAAEHVILVVRQCLGRRNDDRVTGVGAKRIEVLHIAADDRVLQWKAEANVRTAEPNIRQRMGGDVRGGTGD